VIDPVKGLQRVGACCKIGLVGPAGTVPPENLGTSILGIGYLQVSSTSKTASDTRIGQMGQNGA
jgi:hypothetical protein